MAKSDRPEGFHVDGTYSHDWIGIGKYCSCGRNA